MATIKFFDEMQNASNVSGQDKMMIGKAESGETQVITFDQAKQYLDITSNDIAPIVGGDSEANATVVPAGPAGQTRRADVAPGWIDFGSGPIEAAATNRWMAYWDGSSWSLVDMGELPLESKSNTVQKQEYKAPEANAVSVRLDPLDRSVGAVQDMVRTNFSLLASLIVHENETGVMFLVKNNGVGFYRVTRPSVQGNRFRIGYFFDDVVGPGSQWHYASDDVSDVRLEIEGTIPSDATWLGVWLSTTADNVDDYDLDVTMYERVMTEKKFTKVEMTPTSSNLFNKDNVLEGKNVSTTTLNIVDSPQRGLSNAIPIKEGVEYRVLGKTLTVPGRSLFFFDNDSNTGTAVTMIENPTGAVFTAPITGFMRTLAYDASFDWREGMMVSEGADVKPYEPWSPPVEREIIKEEYLPRFSDGGAEYGDVKNVRVSVEHGSLDDNGYYPFEELTWTPFKSWANNDFHKYSRTREYICVFGGSNYSIDLDNSIYDIYCYQYGKSFELISSGLVNNSIQTVSDARYIKLMVTRKDNGDIVRLPFFNINGLFGSNIFSKNNRISSGTIRFVAEVQNVKNGRDMIDLSHSDEPYQYEDEIHYTHGILRLPPNYSTSGEPVRLICFGHGSADWQVMEFGYSDYVQYLVDEGFAVWDAFAWSSKYPDARHYWCTPTNNSCYSAVYGFITNNFNVKQDGMHLFGKSKGGNQCIGLPYCTSIPILSVAILAGSLNSLENSLGYQEVDRRANFADFGCEGDVEILIDNPVNSAPARQLISENIEKFIGMNPLFCGAINFDPLSMLITNTDQYDNMDLTVWSPVPTKSYVSPSDYSNIVKPNELRQRAVRRGGGIFELRYMPETPTPDDGHHAVDTYGPFVASITTKLGIVHENVPVAYAEMLQWFKRYDT